jgi:hypothetical protein
MLELPASYPSVFLTGSPAFVNHSGFKMSGILRYKRWPNQREN